MSISSTPFVEKAFNQAQKKATRERHEFLLPEHLLYALLEQEPFRVALEPFDIDHRQLWLKLEQFFQEEVEKVPEGIDYRLELSGQMNEIVHIAYMQVKDSNAESMDIPHLIQGLLQQQESWAAHLLKTQLNGEETEFMQELIAAYQAYDENWDHGQEEENSRQEAWRNYVTCLNDTLDEHNPLIGREAELERTIQVLCRKEKNNPLHVGESGVGKTSLAYGLAARIESGDVPERLQHARIYALDLGGLLAGTQFRGDFEKRLKMIMEGIRKEGNAIVYIDEIHNLVGTGRTGDSSMDASNMLKPYLEGGEIRFIGSTTYDEYNRYFARSKGMVRRFQQIDILEPGIDETRRSIRSSTRTM